MGCCTYVPKFPTWITPVCVLRWNFVLGRPVRQTPDITGQIQAQDQGASEEVNCTAYFRYPKEHDRLRDLWDLGSIPEGPPYDVISFLLPGGRRVWYKVREVQAMNGGFANGHLTATIAKLTAVEGAAIGCSPDVPPDPPPPPPPDPDPDDWTATIVASPGVRAADSIEETTATLTVRWPDLSPVVGFTPTWASTGNVNIANESGETDANGQATCTGTNDTEEDTVFSVNEIAGIVSNDVLWTNSPPENLDPATVSLFGNTNGSCDDCADLNGTYDLTAVGDHWETGTIGSLCGGLYPNIQVHVSKVENPTMWTAMLIAVGLGSFAQWNGDSGAELGAEGLWLSKVDGNTLCNFNYAASIHPAP